MWLQSYTNFRIGSGKRNLVEIDSGELTLSQRETRVNMKLLFLLGAARRGDSLLQQLKGCTYCMLYLFG